MVDIHDILPIGSIVLLEDGEKRLMITGIMQCDANHRKILYDYLGVPYPEGHIDENHQYLFNHENIARVDFRGYEDEERADFLAQNILPQNRKIDESRKRKRKE